MSTLLLWTALAHAHARLAPPPPAPDDALLARAFAGDGAATVLLGDRLLDRGDLAGAAAVFAFGAGLGDPDAQDHWIWLRGHLDEEGTERAAAQEAALRVRCVDTMPPGVDAEALTARCGLRVLGPR